jgi:hypothetical protein
MKRRTALNWLLGFSSVSTFGASLNGSVDRLGQLEVTLAALDPLGEFAQRERGAFQWLREVKKRGNVPMASDVRVVGWHNMDQVLLPLFVFSGQSAFDLPEDRHIEWLRQQLQNGGMLFFDDQLGRLDSPFFQSADRLMRRIFPTCPGPVPTPEDHTIYQSFYLLKEPRGRLSTASFLTQWEPAQLARSISGEQGTSEQLRPPFTSAFFSHNDWLGALVADAQGRWRYPLEIGGAFRRELCFRFAVNLIYYVLTHNYKKDRAFPPVLRRRRRQ